MLQVVATGACYPPVATTGSYYAQNLKSLEFENHKKKLALCNVSHGPGTRVKQSFS